MAYQVMLTSLAQRQLRHASRWWNAHRPAAPDLVQRELEQVQEMLSAFPESGRLMGRGRRVVVLRKTARIVVYRVHQPTQTIQILRLQPARKS
jgi:plasmid stabilization system protein ParE